MKIIMLLTNGYKPDYRVAKEAQTLSALGHSIVILAWDRSGTLLSLENQNGIRIYRYQTRSSFGAGLRQLGKFLAFYFWVLRYLMSHSFDAVHCHDLDTLPVGFLAAKLKYKRVVYDSHEPVYLIGGLGARRWLAALAAFIESLLSSRVDYVIATNPMHAAKFHRMGIRRVAEVANFPPAALFSGINLIETDRVVFGTVACIRPGIGLELMIDGFKLLREGHPKTTLVIAGHCEQPSYLAALRNRCEGTEDIRFDIENDISRMEERYQRLDVVLLLYSPANKNYGANTSTRLYESMAARKPVITSDAGFTAEVVRREQCGLLLTDYSAVALTAAMRHCCNDRAEMRALGMKGYEAFRQRYYWDLNVESLQRVYPVPQANRQGDTSSSGVENDSVSDGRGVRAPLHL